MSIPSSSFNHGLLGHRGNGDVQAALSTPDELPYVMSLVRQAFEKQMGNGEAEA